jgi:uncharacterized protein with ParB-like and HNH nuclease domain
MKTDKITVFDLFEKQRRYLVPIFQRGYVWTKEAQWEPLWEDICDQAELVQSIKRDAKTVARKHFLGAIVVSQVPTIIREVPASEIIDGQQRLLTLQVFLAAFRDAINDLGDDYLNIQLGRLTNNPGPLLNDDELFKVWPTNAYQEELKNVMTSRSPEALAPKYPQRRYYGKWVPQRPPLVDAYLYFYKMVTDFLRGPAEESSFSPTQTPPEIMKERANNLYEAVIRYVHLVAIELEAEDDPQVIFETLNYRGVPLEPSDLIRNFIFLYAARQGKDVNDLYARWWKDFDEASGSSGKFWKEKEKQGRLFRSRLDLFFFHYLTYQIGSEIKIGHLYQEFKDWWDNSGKPRSLEEELEKAHRSSGIYRSLCVPNEDGRFGCLAQRLKILDTTTVYPFLLWLCEQGDKLAEEESNGMLADIESYVVRRAVCKLTPKNYNRTFLGLLSKLSKEASATRLSLQKELLALKGDSDLWPNNDMFLDHMANDPLYLTIGPRRVRLVLTALELSSRTPKQEAVQLPLNNSLTIEHILPQSFKSEEWPYPIVEKPDLQAQHAQRLIALHTLGNLTLLTLPLNSADSNGPFSTKRSKITGNSLLVLNSYFQRFADNHVWDERTIGERGKVLSELALKVWDYPKL